MMKWLWLLIAIVAFAAAWQAQTPGLLALYLFAGLVATFASFLGFVAARVGAVAQTQMHRESALLATQGARRGGARDAGATIGASYGSAGGARDGRHDEDGASTDGGGGADGGGGGD